MYLIIAFSAALAGAAMAYEGLLSTDDKHGASIQSIEVQLAKHEERIFKLEQVQTKIEVMQNDLTWIRRGLEERKIIAPNPNPNGH